MKFAFMVVTRGNPQRAAGVMECAKALSSGKHQIEFIVGCDNDDPATHSYFHEHYKGARISIGNRPTGIGAVWNRCAAQIDADIYCPFPDDVFISLPDWDDFIVESLSTGDRKMLAWNDLTNPNQCTLPIVSKEWLKLVDGKFYDDRFPFWFYDTCVDEIYSFVTGRHIPIPKALTFVSKKGLTQNLRELRFWWDFYVATRQERIEQARTICEKLGTSLNWSFVSDALAMWERRDKIGRDSASEIELALSMEKRKEPSEQYLTARSAAAAYLGLKAA